VLLLLQTNPVSVALNNLEWVFPTTEIFHIVGFGISIGTIAAIDFSLMGLGFQRKLAPRLLRDTAPWTLTALVIVLIAGAVLFLTDPLMYLHNESFRFKITCLVLAIIFNYTIHRKVASSENVSPPVGILVGAVSLILWVCVVFGGLFIAFVAQ
jgi:hypothetical protein